MRKKIIALLMVLSMVPALAACGSSNYTGNNTSGAATEAQTGETTAAQETEVQSQEETNAETKAEAPALSGTMKVVATSENYVTLFDKFTEDTGVKVELLSMSSGEVLSKLRAEGGTPSADLWFGGGIDAFMSAKDVGRILRTFKIKKNVEVTDNGKIII